MDMQKFIADGCKEALLEEKRRFCFLADKHCMFSYQISNFHEKVRPDGGLVWVHTVRACQAHVGRLFQAREMLSLKLPGWQEKCCDITKVPDTVVNMIEGLSVNPDQPPATGYCNGVRPVRPSVPLFSCQLLCSVFCCDTHRAVKKK